jgi:hypothetical protein
MGGGLRAKNLSKPLASWRIRQDARPPNSDFATEKLDKTGVENSIRRDRERTFEK